MRQPTMTAIDQPRPSTGYRSSIRPRSNIGRASVRCWAMTLLIFGLLSASASANVGTKIIERCTHGQSLGGFSQQAYRKALQEIPTEVEEYSDCAELIHNAQLASASGRAVSSAAAVASLPTALATTPAEKHELEQVHHTGSRPVSVGGQIIHPGVVHANIASAVSSLPSPLLAVLILLLVCALTLAGGALRNRVPRIRRHD